MKRRSPDGETNTYLSSPRLVLARSPWAALAMLVLIVFTASVPDRFDQVLNFCYLVPDGRFVPRWTHAAAAVWALLILVWLFVPAAPLNPIHMDSGDQSALFNSRRILGSASPCREHSSRRDAGCSAA